MSQKLKFTALALAITLGLTGCGKKTADEYTTAIQSYVAAKNTQSAVIELKSAIQDYPTDQSFRQQLGLLALQFGILVLEIKARPPKQWSKGGKRMAEPCRLMFQLSARVNVVLE